MTTGSIGRVYVVGFGASDGGQVRIHEYDFTCNTFAEKSRELVPMRKDEVGRIWWPNDWLFGFAEKVKKMMQPGDALGMYCWGADIAAVRGDELLVAPHYQGILEIAKYQQLVSSVDPLAWHQGFGGAVQAAFQPLAQLAIIREAYPEMLEGTTEFMPVMDYLFGLISGHWGHDPVMAKSQGLLLEPDGATILNRLIDPHVARRICRRGIFKIDDVFENEGCYFVPGTHDSPLARAVGFAFADVVGWSGTWVGGAIKIMPGLVPCKDTLDLGVSFEGLNPPTVQMNTGRFGPAYKQLLAIAKLGYDQAAKLVEPGLVSPPLDLPRITNSSAQDSAQYILSVAGDNPERAIQIFLDNAVAALIRDCRKLCAATGKSSLDTIAVVGGWAENAAVPILAREHGVKVVIPPHAANATEAGMAAEVLRRIGLHHGEEKTLEECLAALPTTA